MWDQLVKHKRLVFLIVEYTSNHLINTLVKLNHIISNKNVLFKKKNLSQVKLPAVSCPRQLQQSQIQLMLIYYISQFIEQSKHDLFIG